MTRKQTKGEIVTTPKDQPDIGGCRSKKYIKGEIVRTSKRQLGIEGC